MKSNLVWLIIKGVLIILFTLVILRMPVESNSWKWMRFGILIVLVIFFLRDLNDYRKPDS